MAKRRRVEQQEDDDEDDEEVDDVYNKMLFTGVMEGNVDVSRAAWITPLRSNLICCARNGAGLFDDLALLRWNVAEQVKYCFSPLHAAAQLDRTNGVQCLIRDFSFPVNQRDWYGETALGIASKKANVELCRVVLSDLKADPDTNEAFIHSADIVRSRFAPFRRRLVPTPPRLRRC